MSDPATQDDPDPDDLLDEWAVDELAQLGTWSDWVCEYCGAECKGKYSHCWNCKRANDD